MSVELEDLARTLSLSLELGSRTRAFSLNLDLGFEAASPGP